MPLTASNRSRCSPKRKNGGEGNSKILLLFLLIVAVDAFHVSPRSRIIWKGNAQGITTFQKQRLHMHEASKTSKPRSYTLGLEPYIEDSKKDRNKVARKDGLPPGQQHGEEGEERQQYASRNVEPIRLNENFSEELNATVLRNQATGRSFNGSDATSGITTTTFDGNLTITDQNKTNTTLQIPNISSTESRTRKSSAHAPTSPSDFFQKYQFPTFSYSPSPQSSSNSTKLKPYSSANKTVPSSSSATASSYNSFLDSVSSSFQTTNELFRSTSANMANLQTRAMSNPSSLSNKKGIVRDQRVDDGFIDPLQDLKPNDTLTVADLERLLRANGYLRQADFQMQQKSAASFAADVEDYVRYGDSGGNEVRHSSAGGMDESFRASTRERESMSKATNTPNNRGGGGVAFPQPSILRYKDLQRGTTVAGGCYGLLFGATILPNLWLVGMILGGVYGYGLQPPDAAAEVGDNPVRKLFVSTGRRCAKWYLQVFDYIQTFWFLYKTGQLSYEYWKRYAEIDERFKIQDKMDAWNARFQDGKERFDKWEKENEIGRTVLAGLRTAWLVEERSRKKHRLTSKYRIVQSFYDLLYWARRRMKRVRLGLKDLLVGSDGTSDVTSIGGAIREFAIGVMRPGKEESSDQAGRSRQRQRRNARIGAVIGSVIALNIAHSLFTIVSPTLLSVSAVVFGLVWPTWITELLSRIHQVGEETRARGRGEQISIAQSWLGLNGRSKDYFVRWDGTRGYYGRKSRGQKRNGSWFKQGSKGKRQRPKRKRLY